MIVVIDTHVVDDLVGVVNLRRAVAALSYLEA